jgi:hypothetical protein
MMAFVFHFALILLPDMSATTTVTASIDRPLPP